MQNAQKVTPADDKNIANLYKNGQSSTQISKIIGVCRSSILNSLKRQNISRKSSKECHKTCYSESDIFSNINTPEKAYWLGFLYADGYNNEKAGVINLRLAIKDKSHVKKFKIFIKSQHVLKIYNHFYKANQKRYKNCGISVNDRKMSEILAKQGCFQKKSLTLRFPNEKQVPKELLWHFLRGYFDGDGSISMEDFSMSIASSKYFCKELINFCKEKDIECYMFKDKNANCYYFKICKRFEFAKFFESLYKNSKGLRLERKYKRYEKTIKRLDNYFQMIYDYMKLRNLVKTTIN